MVFCHRRRVFFKQRDSFFFRSFNYVLSMTITQLPITALEVIFYMTPVYFLVRSPQHPDALPALSSSAAPTLPRASTISRS